MKRLLKSSSFVQSKSTRYYHQETAGKSIMGSTQEQPAPPAYQLGNVYDSYPEIYQGFKSHPPDPYVIQAMNLYDNWEYTEYGSWWNMGSLGWNILWAASPLLLYIITKIQHDNNVARKSCGWFKNSQRAGFTPYGIHIQTIEKLDD